MAMKQHVTVELETVITDHGEDEHYTTQAAGLLYSNPSRDVLIYDEAIDDESTVTNMLTLDSERVSIKRSGPISMHQQFREQYTTENVYQHPYGSMHMETFTRSISYEPPDAGMHGKLVMYYLMSLNGEEQRRHQLTLTMQPKEDET